jgi:hypothetical protein
VLAYTNGAASFAGQTVDNTAVLVRYTWNGDADLNRTIDGGDFFKADQGFGNVWRGYENGDFDFSGSVNADDYWLIDANYNDARGTLT